MQETAPKRHGREGWEGPSGGLAAGLPFKVKQGLKSASDPPKQLVRYTLGPSSEFRNQQIYPGVGVLAF